MPLANTNNDEAQLILGYLYFGGDDNTTSEQAGEWLTKSAKNGNPEAIFLVATTNFKEGQWSSEAENEEQFSLIKEAAEKGSMEAQRSLACSYAHGETVPKDDIKTMYWDEKAAIQGLAESQHDLALMLLSGYEGGVPQVERAIYWYEKAASKDFNVPHAQWAAEELARIYSGEYDQKYTDKEKKNYWEKRAEYLETVEFRSHPDWFYKNM